MSEVILRDTIKMICAKRDEAIDLYATAREHILYAQDAMDRAHAAAREAAPTSSPYTSEVAPEIERFYNSVRMPDAMEFDRVSRRVTDLRVWGHLMQITELDHLMDKQAKDELRKQMTYVPEKTDDTGAVINEEEIARGLPPVSADTVQATLEGFIENSNEIFLRGLANSFANLDRKFRSHDGFKIGSRVILNNALSDSGGWSYYGNLKDTLVDIERVFLILDGKGPRANYAGIVGKVETERREAGCGFMTKMQTEHEGEYFLVRCFMNGNLHLWFTRKDLVEQANKLLAQWYGEVVGDGIDRPESDAESFGEMAVTPARHFGFFPTPETLAHRIVEDELYRDLARDGQVRVLEPSAGTGNLIKGILGQPDTTNIVIDAVEIQPEMRDYLGHLPCVRRVVSRDFTRIDPSELDPAGYHIVLMNPPFDLQRDIDHVYHAFKFLRTGGKLVAIMSAGTEFRENKKAVTFRKLVATHGGRFRDLPVGSFKDSGTGTNVNTIVLTLTKKEER